jgi:hypothetical protein
MFGEIMLRNDAPQNHYASEITGVALLDAIESTVNALAGHTEVLRVIANQGRRIITELAGLEVKQIEVIDPDGAIAEGLRQSAAKVLRDYHTAIERRNCARNDPALTPEDGIEDAYTDHIEVLADLHNALEDMRDVMETVDALSSPVIGTFEGADELFAALDAD